MGSFNGCLGDELHLHTAPLDWVWHGYLARGRITLLTSQWKSGKTTLLSILLARLQSATLAGLPVACGNSVVVSEEPAAQWELRQRRLHFGRNVYFLCRPFAARPSMQDWLELIDHIAQHCSASPGHALVVFDTLSALLPTRSEANAAHVMDALLPLHRLTALGLSVLLLHHPRKGESRPGQAARGSGALAAFVDIVIEMSTVANVGQAIQPASVGQAIQPAVPNRRRRLLAFSRFEETPRELVIEMNAEGTDYAAVGDFEADDFSANWDTLCLVLEDAADKLTRQQILADWPADFPRPAPNTLWRWLTRAAGLNLLCVQGTGRRTEPFLYWLPHKEAQWQEDPLYRMKKQIEEDNKVLREMGIPIP